MSVHNSLANRGRLARARNVLKRTERLEILKVEGRWENGKSVYGLPKTKNPDGAK